MKYRVFALMGLLALTAGTVLYAQDYDDIYYDASKSVTKTKVEKPAKTIAVYGEVPSQYKVAAQDNYRVERDEDEYNRRGAFEPSYEIDINGDTIYCDSIFDEGAFANTRRIERFYNPDIVILSDDDDLVELYYDESPTVNLVVGSDMGYMASYGWATSYYPWYSGWYEPWSIGYYRPWYSGWYSPWYAGWYSPWYYSSWYGPSLWGWSYWSYRPWHHHYGWNPWYDNLRHWSGTYPGYRNGGRGVMANTRRPNGHSSHVGGGGIPHRSDVVAQGGGTRRGSVGNVGTRTRGSGATTRGGGNIGTRSSGVPTARSSSGNGSVSTTRTRTASSGYYNGGNRSVGGSRSSSGSYSGGSRSSSSYSGGSRSSGSVSRSSGSSGSVSRSSGGSYGGGSRSSGGSSGGSSSRGGGAHRR